MRGLRPSNEDLFSRLRELASSSFPKRCNNCGRVYADAAEFASATQPLSPDRSGLKEGRDDDGRAIVELFRNCICGSTLMDAFGDRRDASPEGLARREKFDALFRQLVDRGVDSETAYRALLEFVRGHGSRLVQLIEAHPDKPASK